MAASARRGESGEAAVPVAGDRAFDTTTEDVLVASAAIGAGLKIAQGSSLAIGRGPCAPGH